MEISQREQKYISEACQESRCSPCMQRHGAIAVLNGRVIGRGHNDKRTCSSDGFIHSCMTCHAEINALRNAYHHFKCRGNYRKVGQAKG